VRGSTSAKPRSALWFISLINYLILAGWLDYSNYFSSSTIQVQVLHTPIRCAHCPVLVLLVLLVSRQLIMMVAADPPPSVAAAAAESPSKPAP
jgi:hypothetical protein